jgi:hypothetical protein
MQPAPVRSRMHAPDHKESAMRHALSSWGMLVVLFVLGGCDCGSDGGLADVHLDPVYDDIVHHEDLEAVDGEDIETEPPCDGVPITTSGVLDLDIKAVRVSGHVTLHGGELPDESFARGEIVMTEEESGAALSIPLGSAGSLSYAVTVSPGTYAVSYRADTTGCGGTPPRLMPCVGALLLDNITLTSDGVLDIDIPAVRVSGNVTLNGGPLPAEGGERGSIVFAEASGEGSLSIPLGVSGTVFYDILVTAGTYDIAFSPDSALCDGRTAPAMPCTGGPLSEGLAILSDGTLDLDIPAVTLTGNVTLNGAALPDEPPMRGQVNVAGTDDGEGLSFPLGASGTPTYALTLFPATYDFLYASAGTGCTGTAWSAMPCTGGILAAGIPVTTGGALDLDIRAVRVGGSVLLEGMALPDEALARGEIVFAGASEEEEGGGVSIPLGMSGPLAYEITLFPGTYDVSLSADPDLCAAGAVPRVPCTGGYFFESLPLSADGALDLDIAAVSVGGAVLLDGLQLPDEPMRRGSIIFSAAGGDGGSLAVDLETTGPKTYQVVLFPGAYDVDYEPDASLCATGTARMPCAPIRLHTGLPLTADGALDLNLQTTGGGVRVTGRVTLNGVDLPSESLPRGDILFEPEEGEDGASVPLGSTGPLTYDIRLVPGVYDVVFSGNGALCGAGTMPCNGGAVLEAIPLTADGVLDVDIRSAAVSGAVTVNGSPAGDEPVDRGALLFSLNYGQGATTLPFGAAGPIGYSLVVMQGSYIVTYVTNPALCSPGRAPSLPCMDQFLLGCD